MSEYAVLREVAAAPATALELKRRLNTVAKPLIDQIVRRLAAEGKIVQAPDGRYHIAERGRRALPRGVAPAAPGGVYVPPRVVRRAGSERAGRLPSVFAGKRVERT